MDPGKLEKSELGSQLQVLEKITAEIRYLLPWCFGHSNALKAKVGVSRKRNKYSLIHGIKFDSFSF